eukprot:COSAG05_NODE_7702_length_778_cov_0.826215_1_plen_144_part_00
MAGQRAKGAPVAAVAALCRLLLAPAMVPLAAAAGRRPAPYGKQHYSLHNQEGRNITESAAWWRRRLLQLLQREWEWPGGAAQDVPAAAHGECVPGQPLPSESDPLDDHAGGTDSDHKSKPILTENPLGFSYCNIISVPTEFWD